MPIYEYRCDDCGHELEVLQKLSDPKLTTCPECGKDALNKLVSASAFVLKGSGWYVTDFRDKDKPKAAGKNQGDGKAEAGKSEGGEAAAGSGSKSDAAGETKSKSETPKSDSKPAKKASGE